jgi:hypothetical protein
MHQNSASGGELKMMNRLVQLIGFALILVGLAFGQTACLSSDYGDRCGVGLGTPDNMESPFLATNEAIFEMRAEGLGLLNDKTRECYKKCGRTYNARLRDCGAVFNCQGWTPNSPCTVEGYQICKSIAQDEFNSCLGTQQLLQCNRDN